MKNRKLTPADWEKIIINRTFGKLNKQSAEELGITRQAVEGVLAAFDCVKDQDWARACHLIVTRSMTLDVFKWAAEKCGMELPQVVVDAYDNYQEKRRTDRAATVQQPVKAPETPAHQEDNNRLFYIKMLEHMAKMTELMEQLMDVVIPKYAGDLKDNTNANADLLCQRLKGCEDKLEAIKANTRKRGM